MTIFQWNGAKAPGAHRAKVKLIAARINTWDRNSRAQIFEEDEGHESKAFLAFLNSKDGEWAMGDVPLFAAKPASKLDVLSGALQAVSVEKPKLFKVTVGKGFLELPQITGPLLRSRLDTKFCYILDATDIIFTWWGRKAGTIARAACKQLANVRRFHLFLIY